MFRAFPLSKTFPFPTFKGSASTSNWSARVSEKRRFPASLGSAVASSLSQRLFSGHSNEASTKLEKEKEALEKEKQELRQIARFLTLKLYRTVTRSVRTIRYGNEHDEKEFVEREKKRKESKPQDKRLSMLSMLPPVNREDELRSRAEYYQQYARENFVQESDCFNRVEWDTQRVSRYVHYLRHGEKQRQWLLADMKFPDPYGQSFDHELIDNFEQRATDFVRREREYNLQLKLSPEEYKQYQERQRKPGDDGDDEEDDGWSSEEGEDVGSGLPPWYRNAPKM